MSFPAADALLALIRELEFKGRAARGEPSKEDLETARRAVDSAEKPNEDAT